MGTLPRTVTFSLSPSSRPSLSRNLIVPNMVVVVVTELSQTRWPVVVASRDSGTHTHSIRRGKASALLVPLPPSTSRSILIITSHCIYLKTVTLCRSPEFQQQISHSPHPVPKQMGRGSLASKQHAWHYRARLQLNNFWMPTQGPSPKTSPFLLDTYHVGMCSKHVFCLPIQIVAACEADPCTRLSTELHHSNGGAAFTSTESTSAGRSVREDIFCGMWLLSPGAISRHWSPEPAGPR